MAFVAGTISLVSVSSNSAQLAVSASSGGVNPVSQQWYVSTTNGFTPGVGNAIAGATGLSVSQSSLIPNTTYYYKVVFTDSAPATVTSAQFTVTTASASQSMNQFNQAPFLGQMDLMVGPTNVYAGQIDESQSGPVYAGTAMKIVNSSFGGIPKFVACTAATDETWGFVAYDVKSRVYLPGDRFEIATAGSCMWLYATAQINSGAVVILDPSSQGAVAPASGTHPANSFEVGRALDQAAAYGSLIRVLLECPSNTVIP